MADESSEASLLAAKLHNPELRQLVMAESDEEVSVLIQPAIPERKAETKVVRHGGLTLSVPAHVKDLSADDQISADEQIDRACVFLKELLGASPHWLRSAQSFVAQVNARQLRVIARSPMFKAVWLNRELRKSSF
jgi:hypothetical protein